MSKVFYDMDEEEHISLPDPSDQAFMLAIVGRRNSGKTHKLTTLLVSHYKDKFDLIIWVSPTFGLQQEKTMKLIDNFSGFIVFNEWRPAIIESLYAYMESRNTGDALKERGGQKERALLILDDIGTLGKKGKLSEQLDNLAFVSRNYQVSIAELGQRMTLLSTAVRSQLDCLILFREQNPQELRNLYAAFGFGKKTEFLEIIEEHTREKYSTIGIKNTAGTLHFFDNHGQAVYSSTRSRSQSGISGPRDSGEQSNRKRVRPQVDMGLLQHANGASENINRGPTPALPPRKSAPKRKYSHLQLSNKQPLRRND